MVGLYNASQPIVTIDLQLSGKDKTTTTIRSPSLKGGSHQSLSNQISPQKSQINPQKH